MTCTAPLMRLVWQSLTLFDRISDNGTNYTLVWIYASTHVPSGKLGCIADIVKQCRLGRVGLQYTPLSVWMPVQMVQLVLPVLLSRVHILNLLI